MDDFKFDKSSFGADFFSLLTYQRQSEIREAQKEVPPPDDYIGALFLIILTAARAILGLLFLISVLVLLMMLVKNKLTTDAAKVESAFRARR
ncbi:MAG: hypothetical protein ACR2GD_00945 [Pyrinomonadaceae bacterium]